MSNWIKMIAASTLTFALAACGEDHDHHHDHGDEQELITSLQLAFAPPGRGPSIIARFSDPDGPGGAEPTVEQPAPLTASSTYTLTLSLLDESVDPPVEVTEEIRAEAEEHQVFFSGTAVDAAVRVVYLDRESEYVMGQAGEDLPVGLRSTVFTLAPGSGTFRVVLAHLPALDGQPVKRAGVTAGDGDADLDVTFQLTVQ